MNTKERIEELEKRVRELEARPVYVPQPVYIPAPPNYPPPYWWQQPYAWPQTICGSGTIALNANQGQTQ